MITPVNLNRIIIIISTITVFSSLYLSEIAGIEACKYCWGIRLGLFPILPLSLYLEYQYSVKNKDLFEHMVMYYPFLILSTTISFRYWFGTQFSPQSLKCGLDEGVGCLENSVQIIGFVNLPFVGLGVSLVILGLTVYAKKLNNKK